MKDFLITKNSLLYNLRNLKSILKLEIKIKESILYAIQFNICIICLYFMHTYLIQTSVPTTHVNDRSVVSSGRSEEASTLCADRPARPKCDWMLFWRFILINVLVLNSALPCTCSRTIAFAAFHFIAYNAVWVEQNVCAIQSLIQ